MALNSRYSIIWIKLKKDRKVSLSAPKEAHARLRKAIIKRKDCDIGYKLEMSERNLRCYLKFKSIGSVLHVDLITPLNL